MTKPTQPLNPLLQAIEHLAGQVKVAGELPPQQQLFVLSDALDGLNRQLPPMLWWWQAMGTSLLAAPLHAAFAAKLFQVIPAPPATITVEELATNSGLDLDRTKRVLRFLILYGIFAEPIQGEFTQSPFSAAMMNSAAGLTPNVEWAFLDFQNAATALADAIKDPELDCWKERFQVPLFRWLELEENAEARNRYGRAHSQFNIAENDELLNIVPWGTFKTLVDVGGGAGHVGAHLCKHHPNLQVVNQDLPEVISDRVKELATAPGAEQKSFERVEFEAHDYYTPQSRTDDEAFLLRFVLHNNNDTNCLRILQALIPGLVNNKNGGAARLLIAERVMPDANTGRPSDLKMQKIEDMAMLVTCSGKQRTVNEYETLLKQADERYEIDQVYGRKGSVFKVLSVKIALT